MQHTHGLTDTLGCVPVQKQHCGLDLEQGHTVQASRSWQMTQRRSSKSLVLRLEPAAAAVPPAAGAARVCGGAGSCASTSPCGPAVCCVFVACPDLLDVRRSRWSSSGTCHDFGAEILIGRVPKHKLLSQPCSAVWTQSGC